MMVGRSLLQALDDGLHADDSGSEVVHAVGLAIPLSGRRGVRRDGDPLGSASRTPRR